jgi:protein-glutamine gamma-glutamyltransferase
MTDAASRIETIAPDRATLLAVIGAGAVAVAPHALELPLWVPAVFAAGALWRLGSDRWSMLRVGRSVRVLFVALVTAITWQQHHTFLGRDPGLTLLIALLGLKFLEMRRVRDCRVSVMLFYLVTLGSFLYEQTLLLGLYAAGAVWLSTVTLVRLAQPQGLAWRANLRLSATMLVQALPLMLIIYVLFPRLPGALWVLPGQRGAGFAGLTDTLEPGSVNQLHDSGEVAFRVAFESKVPGTRELYWRALVLWETDGRSWQRGRQTPRRPGDFTPLGEPYTYEIVQEPSQRAWAVALDLPRTLPRLALARSGFTFEFADPPAERRRYAVTSYPRYRTGALDTDERAAALQLPATLSRRVQELGAGWARTLGAPEKIVAAALEKFHREEFSYTLAPPLLGADPVDEFLFDVRRGYCEHYAAAFVTLMRAAGVPARAVLGYQGGEYNAAGNYFIVHQSDAHAWAEVWMEPNGWTRVDPTAAVAPERVEYGMDALRRLASAGTAFGVVPVGDVLSRIEIGLGERAWIYTRLYWDLANISWYRWVADYDRQRQQRLFERLGLDALPRIVLLLGALAVVGTLLAAYAFWRRHERPRVDAVQALYVRYCRKFARAGIPRAPHESSRAFAERCAKRRPELSVSVWRITEEYERLRYGRGAAADGIAHLRRNVAALRVR